MAQLNVRLDEDQMALLRRYAARRRTPVSWLVKDYVDYLLKGGAPITADAPEGGDDLEASQLSALAEKGGSFDWLAEEPEV